MKQNKLTWAIQVLTQRGEKLSAEPIAIRAMPWSQVILFETDQGRYFLKAMAAPFAYEPLLLIYFNRHHFAHVPQLVAANAEMHCFLMQDAGTNLREKLKVQYDVPLVAQALQDYATLQVACVSHVEQLLSCGLADYRLEQLPAHFARLLSQHRDIIIADGLSLAELSALQQIKAVFERLCQQLVALGIPATLEHGDFHDNNLLLKGNRITIHDFGDACLSHPFFSIASFLHSASRHHPLSSIDSEQLLASYLLPWQSVADQQTLKNAYELAYCLRPLVWSLSFVRIYDCDGMTEFTAFKGYLAEALKTLLQNLEEQS